ncbi:uncharacterized protein ASCRUDRAFT_83640 [Ascoidea rubescens DSM 1968]|uniref:Uncharacterized protein n=1 Tax=Ascoidea rubescens DSM 1968 TaxID=1344418 RepID=A0A1D2VQ32_9ASCO|nr:hypothetical protein ASCRUDRAFT_83640 [Ascoidea rubescens DSM 1968]ODV63721.1 hypothetical protein ASCRUDRAFT_83640 [Ascoidea rubescens DSM 1968]
MRFSEIFTNKSQTELNNNDILDENLLSPNNILNNNPDLQEEKETARCNRFIRLKEKILSKFYHNKDQNPFHFIDFKFITKRKKNNITLFDNINNIDNIDNNNNDNINSDTTYYSSDITYINSDTTENNRDDNSGIDNSSINNNDNQSELNTSSSSSLYISDDNSIYRLRESLKPVIHNSESLYRTPINVGNASIIEEAGGADGTDGTDGTERNRRITKNEANAIRLDRLPLIQTYTYDGGLERQDDESF